MTRPTRLPLFTLLLLLVALAFTACDDGDDPPSDPGWTFAFEGLDAALFSIWGTAADDVWVVGADPGDGPYALRYDGATWTRLATGATGDLWWVSGLGDSVWMVGDGGLILRHRRGSGTFERMETPGDPTLFGVIAFAEDDVWAVGGRLEDNTGVVWRFDGEAWRAVEDVPAEGLSSGQLFKVWGRSADDLWIVGLGRVALHRTAAGWQVVPTPRQLFTIHGNASAAVAVGGFQSGLIVDVAGDAVMDVTPEGAPQLNGVWVTPSGDALAVGIQGAIWRRHDGAWAREAAPQSRLNFHATWVDPAGGEWAVGGAVVAPPFDQGMLSHRGDALSLTRAGF